MGDARARRPGSAAVGRSSPTAEVVVRRYLGSKSYRMTLTLRRAELEIVEGSGLSASTVDPYVVVYVGARRRRELARVVAASTGAPPAGQDRQGTKQKTPVCRKTLEPTWEYSILFLGASAAPAAAARASSKPRLSVGIDYLGACCREYPRAPAN